MSRRTRCKWPNCGELIPSWDWKDHRALHENQLNLFEGDTNMGPANYKHTNSKGVTYYLNTKEVTLRGGKVQPIYYFSKDERDTATHLPEGFTVNENPRNGFLTVSRKK